MVSRTHGQEYDQENSITSIASNYDMSPCTNSIYRNSFGCPFGTASNRTIFPSIEIQRRRI